ncbi:GAF domain-containing protein [Neobacillus niacini]|uniref:GAF domain-containing protein n=1 Tax=Neobacillus niacini TaxID=86668 RepID=UPI003982EAA9
MIYDKDIPNSQGIVEYIKRYSLNKNVKDMLRKINPLLVKKENNIRIHLDAMVNHLITKDEYKAIETKIKLGKLCLEIEQVIPDSYVTMLFYSQEENKIYHGAAPSFPIEFFDFFHEINNQNAFNAQCGSCGCAVYQKKVVVTDIRTSPLWTQLRSDMARWGFQTCWSIPFFKEEDVIGTFAIYHKQRKQVIPKEIEMVQQKIVEYQESIYHHYLALDA